MEMLGGRKRALESEIVVSFASGAALSANTNSTNRPR
jgi:hypothetical protein